MQLTINQAFGAFAYETETEVIIKKADLLDLTPALINNGEQILAAIINMASRHYKGQITNENEIYLTDENNNRITYDNRILYEALTLVHFGRYFLSGKIRDTFEYEEFVAE